MASCQLTIKLNETQAYSGGKPITGTIVVRADKNVSCKGLTAKTVWSTHGRGNVESGDVAEQTLFEGTWQAGQDYSYPFSLATALWPPTYHGSYLNVGHYVAARAKLSWATDPKTQVEYQVVVEDAPADLQPTKAAAKPRGFLVAAIFGAIAIAFGLAFLPLLLILLAILAPIGGVFYVVKVLLPKRITGPVTCALSSPKFRAGELVQAKLEFTPARNSTINGIEWTIRCAEECVSGSGSNRQTHTNELFQQKITACGTTELKAGQKQTFEFSHPLPATAAPSLKFTDNKLNWTVQARIDIPRWPDWSKSLDLIVIPNSSAGASQYEDSDSLNQPPVVSASAATSEKTLADEAWLRQVITQIQQSQHDDQALALVLGAVRDFEFAITVSIESEMDTPEFADQSEFERWDDAEWWQTYCPAQNIDIAIAWEDGSPPQVQTGLTWQGTASIIGYEVETKQLLMATLSPE